MIEFGGVLSLRLLLGQGRGCWRRRLRGVLLITGFGLCGAAVWTLLMRCMSRSTGRPRSRRLWIRRLLIIGVTRGRRRSFGVRCWRSGQTMLARTSRSRS